ncbi:hypothetical protein [Lacticaseibacillus rhamnosus]|uniref:hypothetical protein n=1 Tax=Lacticaseibacillus rhamnosus TaxID=47715 RepID=UPI000BAADF32|nr:hypothetical protein [Lacticaseibacillus rhamnosus]ASX16592.1 hypothetical protein BGK71_03985 [Lacticaseibacillus rhamnosus]
MPTINGRACVVNGKPVDKVFSNNIQVYGRNLLTGTSMNKSGIVVAGLNDVDKYDKQKIDVNPNNQYVYSTNIVSSTAYPLVVRNYILWFDKDGKYIKISIGENETINVPNSRILNVFNPPQNASTAYLAPVALGQVRDSDTSLVWNHEKFERGIIVSPWTPAPEDVV